MPPFFFVSPVSILVEEVSQGVLTLIMPTRLVSTVYFDPCLQLR